ncbi:hypothetical protein CDD81_5017 [Ophiocordyceps australis]|uniref:Uncharacterized protein n=1 Tax=Ophiocordyceps australis TaxID=1399860 RepID=A0A2C5XT63_9HYPO|nr:hypothetical protein CDD81_5017 [Ophiocordyceps australis]
MVQNTATRSLASLMSPMCRIPGAATLLPFCALTADERHASPRIPPTVEFDDLMKVQAKFEKVLEKNAHGVSLPIEMKRSETAVRDLRTLVSYSSIPARHELIVEFNGYVEAARRAAIDLQRFNTHVGGTVDVVISINRWTSRYIDSLAPATGDLERPRSFLSSCVLALMAPLLPLLKAPGSSFSEQALADQYIEHTSRVSDSIAKLITEAQALLRLLDLAEVHLNLIFDITARSTDSVKSRRNEILTSLWTLVGANSARLHNLDQQLSLLGQVDSQRTSAIHQVSNLLLELEAIQTNLSILRDRVAKPELVSAALHSSTRIPLSVHIDTIDRGIEKLQAARSRIRATEDDRVREAVNRVNALPATTGRMLDAR